MKSKNTLLIVTVVVILICCFIASVGFLYLQTRPPGALSDSGYYVRLIKVYYYPGFGISEAFEIRDADPFSFEVIDERHAKDKKRVYYNGIPILEADPATFEIIDFNYAKDSQHVYSNGQIFSDDPTGFENITGNIYRDRQHIYWSGSPVSNDPQNLVVIGSFGFYTYFKDSQMVFVNGNPIDGADPASFEVVLEAYSYDSSHAFYFDVRIPKADLATFEAMQPPYARDTLTAYWMGKPIPDSDPATFVVLNADFECTADATHAYYQDQQIQGFDPNSIPDGAHVNSCDLSTVYFTP